MERVAFVALAALAAAAFVQTAALLTIAASALRARRRVLHVASDVMPALAASARHAARTLESAAFVAEEAAGQIRRASSASARVRADLGAGTERATSGLLTVLGLAWKLAPVAVSLGRGLETYRAARPVRRPWDAAIDRGLARYRSEKLARPTAGREPVR